MPAIDINCDMGESYGNFRIGNDEKVFPYITSSNIACGFHGGDPKTIQQTIEKAIRHKVSIGALPSFPDLAGFGRRRMDIAPDDLAALLLYQVSTLKSMTEALGGELMYVKPHGALYHQTATNKHTATTVCNVLKMISPHLSLLCLAGSKAEAVARKTGIKYISEAFLDRRYNTEGELMSRSKEGAVILDEKKVVHQFVSLVKDQKVESSEGKKLPIHADSLCIHGDNPNVINILKAVHQSADKEQITIQPFIK